MLEAIGKKVTEEEIKKMIERFNTDGDDEISYEEFLQLMSEEMASNLTGEELVETFKTFGPKDEKGCITFKDLKKALEGEKELKNDDMIKQLFDGIQKDKDTKGITFSDFILLMMAN